MIITKTMLENLHACRSQVNLFSHAFPNGMDSTSIKHISRAFKAGLKMEWFAYFGLGGERWAEAEEYIIQMPQNAAIYAANILGTRWAAAEASISSDVKAVDLYVSHLIHLSLTPQEVDSLPSAIKADYLVAMGG